jgi:prepilin-type N-terminal cleavage/methylation domain-containing protein
MKINSIEKKLFRQRLSRQRGVSLIEILLVVAIIVIMAAITIPIENGVLTRQYLTDGTGNIQMALRTANLQAKLGTHNLDAGVWIGEPVDGIYPAILYRGPSYEKRTVDLDEPIDIPGGLTISVTPDTDIHFSVLTAANEHDSIIKIQNSSGEKVLHVNTLGTVIEEHEPTPIAQ